MARTPHGYHDLAAIGRDLREGGFAAPAAIRDDRRAQHGAPRLAFPRSPTAKGTPLRSEIEARDKARLGEATDVAAAAIARRFGDGAVDGKIQAHVVVVER